MKKSTKIVIIVFVALIIVGAVAFFYPKECARGVIHPDAVWKDCDCLGFKANLTPKGLSGSYDFKCFGIVTDRKCYKNNYSGQVGDKIYLPCS